MKITRNTIKENIVFRCNTVAKADEFLEKLDSLGYTWRNGKSYLDENGYRRVSTASCYCPYNGTIGSVRYFENHGYDIIEYELDKYSKEFIMDDIKDGYLVELRNGDKYLCCSDNNDDKILVSDKKQVIYCSLYSNFNMNITIPHSSDYDIIKVYGRSLETACLLSSETVGNRRLLWKREEEIETIEVTLKEVCKMLGKNVKIIQ